MKAQAALSEELMTIRFTAKTIEKLCDMVRGQVDDVQRRSASCAASSWTSAACPKGDVHQGLPAQPAEPAVGREAGRRWQALVCRDGRNIPPIRDLQKADRPAVARGCAAGRAQRHQQAHERR